MSNKQSSSRSRNFSLMTYHDIETIAAVICANSVIRHWAYITHDKDVNPENSSELKKVHRHLLLNLNNAMTLSAVRKLFPDSQNTLAQVIRDKSACFDYLTHKDNPDKYQYDEKEVVCDDWDYWHSLQDSTDKSETLINLLEDIISGVEPLEMVRRYGRDYVINFDKYFHMADCIRRSRSIPLNPEEYVIVPKQDYIELTNTSTGESKEVGHR